MMLNFHFVSVISIYWQFFLLCAVTVGDLILVNCNPWLEWTIKKKMPQNILICPFGHENLWFLHKYLANIRTHPQRNTIVLGTFFVQRWMTMFRNKHFLKLPMRCQRFEYMVLLAIMKISRKMFVEVFSVSVACELESPCHTWLYRCHIYILSHKHTLFIYIICWPECWDVCMSH